MQMLQRPGSRPSPAYSADSHAVVLPADWGTAELWRWHVERLCLHDDVWARLLPTPSEDEQPPATSAAATSAAAIGRVSDECALGACQLSTLPDSSLIASPATAMLQHTTDGEGNQSADLGERASIVDAPRAVV